MKTRISVLNFLLLTLMSCVNQTQGEASITKDKAQKKSLISANAISQFKYNDYVLSTDAENTIVEWEKYKELSIQIDYLRKADLSFFNGQAQNLKDFMEEFIYEIPEDLQQNPILSRVAVVQTMVLRLNEHLTLDNIKDDLKLQSVKEVLEAFSNLNYQINKKIERDKYDKIKSEY